MSSRPPKLNGTYTHCPATTCFRAVRGTAGGGGVVLFRRGRGGPCAGRRIRIGQEPGVPCPLGPVTRHGRRIGGAHGRAAHRPAGGAAAAPARERRGLCLPAEIGRAHV